MTVQNPWAMQANSHPAARVRESLMGLFNSPVGAFAGGVQTTAGGGGHGVCGDGDYKVTATGTPDMNVHVAQGLAAIRGTESQHQAVYGPIYNNASVTLAISTADVSLPRNDLIVVKVRDSAYSGSSDDATLAVVTGTPNASPSDPSVPNNALVLARVRVEASAGTIVSAKITDLRVWAFAVGGIGRCTSATRPSGAAAIDGQSIYEIDTKKMYTFDGTNWVPPDNVSGGTLGYAQFTTDKTGSPGSGGTIALTSTTVTAPAGRRVTVKGKCRDMVNNQTSGAWSLQIREGATVLAETLCNDYDNAVAMAGGNDVEAVVTPTAGSHTYSFVAVNVFGTGSTTVEAASTAPGFIHVQDAGGA